MLDIGGFLTGTEFLTQLAVILTTFLSTIVSRIIAGLFA